MARPVADHRRVLLAAPDRQVKRQSHHPLADVDERALARARVEFRRCERVRHVRAPAAAFAAERLGASAGKIDSVEPRHQVVCDPDHDAGLAVTADADVLTMRRIFSGAQSSSAEPRSS